MLIEAKIVNRESIRVYFNNEMHSKLCLEMNGMNYPSGFIRDNNSGMSFKNTDNEFQVVNMVEIDEILDFTTKDEIKDYLSKIEANLKHLYSELGFKEKADKVKTKMTFIDEIYFTTTNLRTIDDEIQEKFYYTLKDALKYFLNQRDNEGEYLFTIDDSEKTVFEEVCKEFNVKFVHNFYD